MSDEPAQWFWQLSFRDVFQEHYDDHACIFVNQTRLSHLNLEGTPAASDEASGNYKDDLPAVSHISGDVLCYEPARQEISLINTQAECRVISFLHVLQKFLSQTQKYRYKLNQD